jgi:integrase
MATFRKRSGAWQVRVQRKGFPEQSKTFTTRSEGNAWARVLESEMDRGVFVSRIAAETTIFSELLTRYLKEITPHKKHSSVEAYRIQAWLRCPLAKRFVSTLRSSDFASWRDARVQQGISPNTLKLEFAIISHLYFVARSEWGFESLDNPIQYMRMPALPKGRARRVSDEEVQLLIKHTGSLDLSPILRLAIETGMRRGEIASLTWKAVDFNKRVLELKETKNGENRFVPLSSIAMNILSGIPRRIDGRLFGMTAHAITYAFIRACKRAALKDLHFHDLRHEAITRLFEKGLNVMEVGSISGHKTLQMLQRYTHLRVENLLERLG